MTTFFGISPGRVYGSILRYVYVYRRNYLRLFELYFWPVINLMVWGFLYVYLNQMMPAGKGNGQPVAFLLGGMLLWDVQFRSTQGVSVSFLEDIWTRNLLNIFVAPVRTVELVLSMCTIGFLRVVATLPVLLLISYLGFDFNIFQMHAWLLPFYGNLLLFGWGLGMIANSLVLRWGQAAEGLSWAMPFMVQPFSAVFYAVHVLPDWIEPVAWMMPATHVFEGMRAVLAGNMEGMGMRVVWATGLNVLWLTGAGLIMGHVLNVAKEKGLLVKVGTQ